MFSVPHSYKWWVIPSRERNSQRQPLSLSATLTARSTTIWRQVKQSVRLHMLPRALDRASSFVAIILLHDLVFSCFVYLIAPEVAGHRTLFAVSPPQALISVVHGLRFRVSSQTDDGWPSSATSTFVPRLPSGGKKMAPGGRFCREPLAPVRASAESSCSRQRKEEGN